MNIAIDGIVFENQQVGGISRLFRTILPLMCEQDPTLNVTLYLEKAARATLPCHPNISVKRILPFETVVNKLPPKRLWLKIRPARTTRYVRSLALGLAVERGVPSLWHSTYYTQPLMWPFPKVVTVFDLIFEKFPHLFSPETHRAAVSAMRSVVQQADLVLCISNATSRELQRIYQVPQEKIRVVHLAADPIFAQLNQKAQGNFAPTSKPYLLYVGGRARYKNFESFLLAYSQWVHRAEVDLVAVGSPWTDKEKKMLATLSVEGNVFLMNAVSDEKLAALYAEALAFVYPSIDEGFGIPLLEAMSCGCPIVASRIPSSEEIAGEYPIYFDLNHFDSLVQALNTVVTEGRSPFQVQLGKELAAKFSWDATAAATLEAYWEVERI